MRVDPECQRPRRWTVGLAKIDGLGLESSIERLTNYSEGLDARCGYRPVQKVGANMDRSDATAEGKEWSAELMLIGYLYSHVEGKGRYISGGMENRRGLGMSD